MNVNYQIDFTRLLPERTLTSSTKKKKTHPKVSRIKKVFTHSMATLGMFTVAASVCLYFSAALPKGISYFIGPVFSVPDITATSSAGNEDSRPDDPNTSDNTFDDTEDQSQNKQETDIYAFDYTSVPEGNDPIIPTDLSTTFAVTEELYLSNATNFTPDLPALYNADYPLAPAKKLAKEGEPIVLIIHTHGTEAYSDKGSTSYSASYNIPRSSNTEMNVVSVGNVMSEVFTKCGIANIHCTVMHDKESYKDSYSRAAETIKAYLKEYPSIKYVFDVHRDSIVRANGEKIRPVFEYEGEPVAQVMSVVGTNELGADFPDWEKNLNLALKLHTALEEEWGAISRPINLRGAAFNEHYSAASLLLEVGSCGNTLEEAQKAGELLAYTLAELIIEGNGK